MAGMNGDAQVRSLLTTLKNSYKNTQAPKQPTRLVIKIPLAVITPCAQGQPGLPHINPPIVKKRHTVIRGTYTHKNACAINRNSVLQKAPVGSKCPP